jgi:putative peptidoglycan lipid II flippase
MIENPDPANNPQDPVAGHPALPSAPSDSGASTLAGQVAGTTVLLGGLILLGKGTGLLRELIIAREYGAGPEYDAFLIAMTLPDLVATVALYVTLNLFLPIYLAERARSPQGADRLASVFWGRSTLVLVAATAVLGLMAPFLIGALAPGLEPPLFRVAVTSLRLLAWIVLFRGIQGFLRGLVNAHRRFVIPTVGGVLWSLVIIAFVLLGSERWGVRALVWGVVVGNAVPALVILPTALKTVPRLFRDLAASHPAMRDVARVLPWILAIEVTSLVLPLVDRAVATRYLAAGRISALAYARIINDVPMDLIALTLATVLFPEFAALHARGDRDRFRRMVRRGVRAAVAVVLPIAVLFVVLRVPMVRAVYERGAFTAEATRLTASALWAFAVGLPFLAAAAIATQAAYASRRLRSLFLFKGIALGVKVAVTLLLVGRLGHAGIALGTAGFFMALSLLLLPAMAGGLRGLVPRPLVLAGATLLAAGTGWGLTQAAARAGMERGVPALAAMAGVWAAAGLVYLGVCRLGRVEEVLWVESLIRARFAGGRRR